MNDDAELLQRYARADDEAAFAELVRRHVNLVHSAALRQTNGDAHLAEDVTQMVFADLARKAELLTAHRVLTAWLFTSTRFAAAKVVRGERRRQVREQEAHTMHELSQDPTANEWERVRPVLDEAMSELNEADREAVLLRYFENRGFAELGARLNLNENTARMRVERALDKLHGLLARRGVASTSSALAAALANQAVIAAPAGLAVTVTGAALAGATATVAATASVGVVTAGGAAAFLGLTKLQLGLASVVMVAGTSGFVAQHAAEKEAAREVVLLRAEQDECEVLRRENVRLARAVAEAQQLRLAGERANQLRDEAAALRRQLSLVEQARAAAAAQAKQAALLAARTANPNIDLSKIDRLPQATGLVPPKYPQAMREAGITGEVLVRLIVDANGQVKDAFPVKSSRSEFEAAAIEAVKQWTFDPGMKGGRVVNTRMEQPIRFSLADEGGGVTAEIGALIPADNAEWF